MKFRFTIPSNLVREIIIEADDSDQAFDILYEYKETGKKIPAILKDSEYLSKADGFDPEISEIE